jgi:hypothetical protein
VRIEGPSAIVERRVAARAQISAIFTSAEYLLNHCRDYLRSGVRPFTRALDAT